MLEEMFICKFLERSTCVSVYIHVLALQIVHYHFTCITHIHSWNQPVLSKWC